jgi:hypothetical protein
MFSVAEVQNQLSLLGFDDVPESVIQQFIQTRLSQSQVPLATLSPLLHSHLHGSLLLAALSLLLPSWSPITLAALLLPSHSRCSLAAI